MLCGRARCGRCDTRRGGSNFHLPQQIVAFAQDDAGDAFELFHVFLQLVVGRLQGLQVARRDFVVVVRAGGGRLVGRCRRGGGAGLAFGAFRRFGLPVGRLGKGEGRRR